MLLGKLGQNRRISVVFAAVTLLHGLFLLIPVARQALYETPPATTLHLRLAPEPQPARQPPSPVVAAAPKPVIVPREPIELADLPVPPEQTLPPTQPAEPKAAPDAINRQILSSQFSYEKSKPLFDDQQAPEKRSDYQVWERPVLEQIDQAHTTILR